jgi:hypothetical protein
MHVPMVDFEDRLRDDVESENLLFDVRRGRSTVGEQLASISTELQKVTDGALRSALTGEVDTIARELQAFERHLPLGQENLPNKAAVQNALAAVNTALGLATNLRSPGLDALPHGSDAERALQEGLRQQVSAVVDELTAIRNRLQRLEGLRP